MESMKLLVPRQIRRLPADLAGVLIFTLGANLSVLTPGLSDSLVRTVVTTPLVLFFPGYAVIAALYPEASETEVAGITDVERIALSIGLSVALTALVTIGLTVPNGGIATIPVIVSLSGLVVVSVAIADIRRHRIPEEQRFRIEYSGWIATAKDGLFGHEGPVDYGLTIVVVLSVLLAGGMVGYALVVPPAGSTFTEFYLLGTSENEVNTSNYPSQSTLEDTSSVVIGVKNMEHQPQTYSIVVKIQHVVASDEGRSIREERIIDRFDTSTLDYNESWHQRHEIPSTMSGNNSRLHYLLYTGEEPSDPSAATAYRQTHLWINSSVSS